MARIKKVGTGIQYRSEKCPQCKKYVGADNILDKGLKCPRCGLFSWKQVQKMHKETTRTFENNPDLKRT
jgi:hypothetical protein